ncbi:MAG: hypothetical protein U1D25_13210 [Hydrogenophaga sp.]|uniref:hypothetical protein n=1 Tax=Hydrogenophaga sp. TaxID=1904254 RepID=UPI0027738DE8|nr:hypothetical protein [Hydrogenophaga sp.]MDP2415959.1 hypothetical protein [Hydrogenophaga sp.]MDZ4189050.1 hypothetical protein [Hydrogenophaga sp.]
MNDNLIRLDLNNPVFQEHLFGLQKTERNAVMDTLRKIRQLCWGQLYRDNGLKWEKIVSVKPPLGVDAIYTLRITQSRRCTAYRDGNSCGCCQWRLTTTAPTVESERFNHPLNKNRGQIPISLATPATTTMSGWCGSGCVVLGFAHRCLGGAATWGLDQAAGLIT